MMMNVINISDVYFISIIFLNIIRQGYREHDLNVTIGRVIRSHEDLARREDASFARLTLQATNQSNLKKYHDNSFGGNFTKVEQSSKSDLLLCDYQCNDQENPKAQCQSQEIHYSLFCLE